jgi:hypothetical protein
MTSHGYWNQYVPAKLPKELPIGTFIFLKRTGDGKDWYDYIKNNMSFPNPDSIKVAVQNNICTIAYRDPTMLFPLDATVYDIDDTTSDPKSYVGKVLENGVFVDPSIPVPAAISDRQFFQQLAIQGIITEDQALAANAAVIPPPLLALIEGMPQDQQFGVKMLVGGAVVFHRNHPVTEAIGTAYGWSPTQIDDFFRAAAKL